MNIEPDIFDYLETTSLEPHDDYTSEITYKDQKIIWNRLKQLQQELDQYKNNWEELKKWLISYRTNIDNPDFYEDGIIDCLDETLNKLKSMKEGK